MTDNRSGPIKTEVDGAARFRMSRDAVTLRRILQPRSPKVEKLLARIGNEHLRFALRRLLQQVASQPGLPAPLLWAESTLIMVLTSIVDALEACHDAGVEITALTMLAAREAVMAVEARVGRRWGAVKASMVLAHIRKVVIASGESCSVYLTERQSFLARQPRRDISHRVFPAEDYTGGAAAIGAIGRVMAAVGRRRGQSLLQGAAMLALGSVAHPRRGEYIRLTCGDLKLRTTLYGERVATIVINPSKTGVDGATVIDDPRILQLLKPFLNRPACTPIFTNVWGEKLCPEEVANTLAQVGTLAVGQPACANILRRAATIGKPTEQSHTALRNSKQTTQAYYEQNEREKGIAALQRSSDDVRELVQQRRLELARRGREER